MYNWLFIISLTFIPEILPLVGGPRIRDRGFTLTALEEILRLVIDTSRPDGSGITSTAWFYN